MGRRENNLSVTLEGDKVIERSCEFFEWARATEKPMYPNFGEDCPNCEKLQKEGKYGCPYNTKKRSKRLYGRKKRKNDILSL